MCIAFICRVFVGHICVAVSANAVVTRFAFAGDAVDGSGMQSKFPPNGYWGKELISILG